MTWLTRKLKDEESRSWVMVLAYTTSSTSTSTSTTKATSTTSTMSMIGLLGLYLISRSSSQLSISFLQIDPQNSDVIEIEIPFIVEYCGWINYLLLLLLLLLLLQLILIMFFCDRDSTNKGGIVVVCHDFNERTCADSNNLSSSPIDSKQIQVITPTMTTQYWVPQLVTIDVL